MVSRNGGVCGKRIFQWVETKDFQEKVRFKVGQ